MARFGFRSYLQTMDDKTLLTVALILVIVFLVLLITRRL